MLATASAGDQPPDAVERRVQLADPTLGLTESHEGLPQDEARGQLVLGPPNLPRPVDGVLGQPGRFGIVPLRQGDLRFSFGQASSRERLMPSLDLLSPLPQLDATEPRLLPTSPRVRSVNSRSMPDWSTALAKRAAAPSSAASSLRRVASSSWNRSRYSALDMLSARAVIRGTSSNSRPRAMTSSNLGRASSCRPIPVRVSAWTDPFGATSRSS